MAEHEEFDHRRQALTGAIGVLNPRERRIFEARRLADEPMTLEDLAAEFGVSRERVRQIEVRAFEKVQTAVKGTIARQEQDALEAALLIARHRAKKSSNTSKPAATPAFLFGRYRRAAPSSPHLIYSPHCRAIVASAQPSQ